MSRSIGLDVRPTPLYDLPALDGDGFDRLMCQLEELGSSDLSTPAESLRVTLQGAAEEGWAFDDAWGTAMRRLQPSQAGGVIDLDEQRELAEARVLLEEDRPLFQAAFEGRDMTLRERGQRVVSAWGRTGYLQHGAQNGRPPASRRNLAA
jgi:hypothetical protein